MYRMKKQDVRDKLNDFVLGDTDTVIKDEDSIDEFLETLENGD